MLQLLLIALRKLWPYVLGAAAILGLTWWVHHHGYESGFAASEALWQGRFAQAERALVAANEKARRMEEDSREISQQSEIEHAKTVASLNLRAADADKRIRALGVRIAAARACGQPVPSISRATAEPHAASEVERRAEDAGGRISSVGAACESDAATLIALQRWVIEQRRIINR